MRMCKRQNDDICMDYSDEKGVDFLNIKKIALVSSMVGIGALAAVYIGGRQYYGSHFLPHTVINEVACDGLTDQAAIDQMTTALEQYRLTIHDAVTDMTLSAGDAGMSFTNGQVITDMMEEQNNNLWFLELAKDHNYTVETTAWDKDQMKSYLNTLECMNPETVQKPKSAKVKYHEDTKCFEIEPEVIGNVIEEDAFYAAVEDAVASGADTLDLTSNAYYKQPTYKATDEKVLKAKEKVDSYMSSVITLKHGDFEVLVDGEAISQFVKVKNNMTVVFIKDNMVDYIVNNVCAEFNTIGTTRNIHSPGSGDITVSGGAYGWRVNVKKERLKLKKEIKAGAVKTRKPVYMQKAKSREKGNDIGDSYVDVSIANQTLWVIQDGKIVFSSVFVSGNPNLGRQTDKGVHYVEYKRTNYDMSNYNVTVQYWLPFNTAEGEGFHDATWRNTFGGSYYLKDGSHGCINLPLSAAKTLYYMLPCGYPVVVH